MSGTVKKNNVVLSNNVILVINESQAPHLYSGRCTAANCLLLPCFCLFSPGFECTSDSVLLILLQAWLVRRNVYFKPDWLAGWCTPHLIGWEASVLHTSLVERLVYLSKLPQPTLANRGISLVVSNKGPQLRQLLQIRWCHNLYLTFLSSLNLLNSAWSAAIHLRYIYFNYQVNTLGNMLKFSVYSWSLLAW